MHRIVAAAVVAASLAVPGAPARAAASTTHIVPTRHGLIYLEVEHPAPDTGLPVVLTYSPYSVLGRNSDAGNWTGRGYARAWADVVGTGESGGCYDYGGKREKESAYDLVEWIAAQPWSNGRVGMIGGSYNGTTAIAAAVTRPPHLVTIVPQAAISRWYDYAFSGGMRYSLNNEKPADEGVDTPLLFDFGFAIPPPLGVTDPEWAGRVGSTITPCDELKHTQYGYSQTPDYDAFWKERDYAKDAHRVKIPILVSHNWGDWNVKQDTGVRFYRAATKSTFRRLYMGSRYDGHGTPGGAYRETVYQWMERWLQNKRNGLERDLPAVTTQTAATSGRGDWWAGPEPRTTPLRLYTALDATASYDWRLTATKPSGGTGASYVPTGSVTETEALSAPRASGGGWVWFETPPLARDVRIFGSPTVRFYSETDRTWITVAASVADIDPARYQGAGGLEVVKDPTKAYGVTRAWLDSRYRDGLASRKTWTAGGNGMTLTAKPVDWTFKSGHRIGLLISAEQLDWVIAKGYDGAADPTVTVDVSGKTWLDLPVVGKVDRKRLFGSG